MRSAYAARACPDESVVLSQHPRSERAARSPCRQSVPLLPRVAESGKPAGPAGSTLLFLGVPWGPPSSPTSLPDPVVTGSTDTTSSSLPGHLLRTVFAGLGLSPHWTVKPRNHLRPPAPRSDVSGTQGPDDARDNGPSPPRASCGPGTPQERGP